ncbi:MAG: Ig-like domain-containing protein, partial [Desulfobacteraceae bacterium]|nr:Ig-like domain-containing protein [Desulfobacteraceae bacterium]
MIYKKTNEFRIKFNEDVDPDSIESSIEIKKTDGSITGTITMVDDRTLDVDLPETLILGKEYQVWVKALLTDESGMAANEFFHRFVVMDDDMLIYEKDPNKHAHSKIGNNHLFHGRT